MHCEFAYTTSQTVELVKLESSLLVRTKIFAFLSVSPGATRMLAVAESALAARLIISAATCACVRGGGDTSAVAASTIRRARILCASECAAPFGSSLG